MKSKRLNLNVKIVKESPNEIIGNQKETINYKNECSEILTNVYISGYKFSCDYEYLTKNKFTSIINCAGNSKSFKSQIFDNFTYLTLDIKDDPGYEIIEQILISIKFIENCLSNNDGKVLIHCFEGISRGPTLIAGYLMWKFSLPRDQAINFIKEKRPNIEINLGFLVQLDKWDLYLKNYRQTNQIELVSLNTVNVVI
jgi:protein-tyrosine phosphatase